MVYKLAAERLQKDEYKTACLCQGSAGSIHERLEEKAEFEQGSKSVIVKGHLKKRVEF